MSVGKTRRFEVFKRDGFQCTYCGKAPPEVVLECDHVNPVAAGGLDDINNLTTACFDCNRGKRDKLLSVIPSTVANNLDILKEKESQFREYQKHMTKMHRRIEKSTKEVCDVFLESFNGPMLKSQMTSMKRFLKELAVQEVVEAMSIACDRQYSAKSVFRYFCGICWNKIREKNADVPNQKLG